MTDRDHFAAAALTGLLAQGDDGSFSEESYARAAYRWADAMLRERDRTNHDAAPAARAAPSESSAPLGKGLGTGDTQEIAAYRRFVGEVMNWISEATGFLHDDVLRTDDARDIIHNACMRCWDAFDRIAYPTIHGAAPEATAESDEDRTDKAATSHRRDGTGDTPDSPKPIKGGVSDRSKPINGPDPDSRVWETPVHTPATHATRGEGSVRRECTEPVAWAVMDGHEFMEFCADKEEAKCAAGFYGDCPIVPLYRHPPCQDSSQKNLTLTDAEAETLRELRDEAAQYADEIGLCASEVRVRQRIIDGLLRRLGGEK